VNVVIDTNIIISTLVFSSGQLDWLREAWVNQRITPLTNTPCSEELLRALTYPKFKLTGTDIENLLGDYLPFTKVIYATQHPEKPMPQCRDSHDQKFLHLAYAGKAEALITGDKALLELNKLTPFNILTASAFRKSYFES